MGKVVDEIWRPIKDYEGLYEISNYGNVKSLSRFQNGRKRKIEEHYIKQFDDKNGYFQITLFKNRKKHCLKVHRLVAETFIPNPNNLPCVNHKDGNKINNRVDNLEWCSYKENTNHAWKIGLCSTRKYKHYSTKIVKMNEKSEILEIYESQKIASEKNNISFRAINNCLRGKSKFAGGFKWKYFEEGVDRVGA